MNPWQQEEAKRRQKPHRQGQRVDLVKVRQGLPEHPEETPPLGLNPQEVVQLPGRNQQPRSRREADHDRVGDIANNPPEAQQPKPKLDQTDHHGQEQDGFQ